MQPRVIEFNDRFDRLTHYLFRYPAKFHPPVASFLIDRYSTRSGHVLDPFCGSGTLLVEGVVAGRRMHGVDVDPVACFVARVKSTPVLDRSVYRHLEQFIQRLSGMELSTLNRRWIPDIPNIAHWFEEHVLAQMGALIALIRDFPFAARARDIAECAFLSCIRGWSNADPVPVSGLEVTSHIKAKRAHGFFPDVKTQYTVALRRAAAGVRDFSLRRPKGSAAASIINSDAYGFLSSTPHYFDSVITSPPYLTAVDYYRRHTLEMFWLDPTMTREKRLLLKRDYIGQYQISTAMTLSADDCGGLTSATLRRVEEVSAIDQRRGDALRHYFLSLKRSLAAGARATKPGGSLWCGIIKGAVGLKRPFLRSFRAVLRSCHGRL